MLLRVILIQLLSFTCLAQQNLWQSVGIANGLSQGMVYDMMQDREGFMWVATKDGLNRYDGYNFKVFTHDPYQEYSVSGNTCTALLEDSQGRIWISTEKDGLNLFDPRTQRFYHANLAGSGFIIIFVKEDTQGNIWLITDKPDKTFYITKKDYPTQSDFSNWLQQADASKKRETRFAFDYRSIGIQYVHDFFGGSRFPDKPVEEYKILEDKQKRYWLLGKDKLHCYKGTTEIKTIPYPRADINILNQFDDGSIAISNQVGVWIFKPEELLKTDRLTHENAFSVFPDGPDKIRQFAKDKSGNIWAGTLGYGLKLFNKNIRQFQSVLPSYSPSHLFEDRNGRIFMNTNLRPSNHFYEINPAQNTISIIPTSVSSNSYAQDALFQSKKGEYYVIHHNMTNRAISRFSSNWQFLKQYDLTAYSAPINYSTKIIEDKAGQLWLGLSNGNLLKFNSETEQFQVFSYQHILPKNNTETETFALYEDLNNVIWIGTQKGLIKTENLSKSPRYTLYKNSKTNKQSLSNDFVSAIINDPTQPQRYLWVSTKGGGLERLDKSTGKFEHFTEKQGLPNKVVYGILADNNSHLWLSTNRGLSRLNLKTLTFANFSKFDGIQDDEFNTNSYYKGPSGRLLFGGINGVTIITPSAGNDNKQIPTIKMIGLKINNNTIDVTDTEPILEKAIEYLEKLEVAHDQNQISLEFGLMDFSNPAKNRFRYQLEGIDNKWVEAGNNHFANYVQLPSGNYTFKVIGTVDGEIWSKPISLAIHVNPPFYRSWWAYLLYITLFIYIAYRLYQNQLNKVRLQEQLLYKNKEAERLSELDTLKTRFFANISHELRTPLTLLSGPLTDLSKKYPHERMFGVMQRNLVRLQNLINQILDLSKLEAGKMKPQMQQGDLAAFVKHLLASFESLAHSKGIKFAYNKTHSTHIGYFDADKFEKIISNLLANAFKFTSEGGVIEVKTSYSAHTFTFIIQDSGIGIEQQRLPFIFDRFYQAEDSTALKSYTRNYEGTGIGLALVKELVDILKGKIQVESQIGIGTTFTLNIPTEKATWQDFINQESLVIVSNSTDKVIAEPDSVNEKHSQSHTPDSSADTEQPILLIIEDNDDLRTYIRSHFEQTYQIIEAIDGQDGYEKTLAAIPDLVICDLMMPRLDGFSFCKLVKCDIRTNHIPVIMLTARAALEDRLEGLELGADDYLAKPFNTEELQIRVRNLINIRQALQQKYAQNIVQTSSITETKSISLDEQFLQKAYDIIDKNLQNTEFNITLLADEMHMTAGQLRRKLKAITNQGTLEFIRNYKLQKAAILLQNKSVTVSDVAYQVGFENLSYFSKIFFETFGKYPSEWKN